MWVGRNAPTGHFTFGEETTVPIVQVAVWAPGPVKTGMKKTKSPASSGVRTPERLARGESLSRLQ
jgi:hypothetical protein